ncbi:MAG: peptide deformylase [Bacteroidetes bacterium]|nr:MAG: peptide deformylase [Bacteroidota bacterium]
MILPIVAYGDAVLKKVSVDIEKTYPDIQKLIADMFETMYAASGVGLAAPQIGKNIRLFIADGTQIDTLKDSGFKKVFINAEILEEDGEEWSYNEGCLSIPGVREDVMRLPKIKIKYLDENFKSHTEEFDGIQARIIQHEYDHIEGVLFVDHLSALKKQLIRGKLQNISKGKTDAEYRMKFPLGKK